MSSLTHAPPILPLSNSPLASRRFRSTSRRLSYTLKNRAGRYAVPLSVGSVIALVFLIITWSRTPSHHYPSHRVKLYTREQIEQATFGTPSRLSDPYDNDHAPRPGRIPVKGDGGANGVSNLVESEEELIAEDDLFWMNYKEPTPLSDKEKAANKEIEEHRQDVKKQNELHSLKALIWWIAEGGVIPHGWEVPTKSYFDKFGARGMERLLNGIDKGKHDPQDRGDWKPVADDDDEENAFSEGWGDFAESQLSLVVFSKTYCPYSKRAKAILQKYSLSPSPFIVELDTRADTGAIQNLLFHLTGRRTVPNIILNFKSLGGADELTLMDAEGGLQRRFNDAGIIKPARNEYLPDFFDEDTEDDDDSGLPVLHAPQGKGGLHVDDEVEVDEVNHDEDHDFDIDVERRKPAEKAIKGRKGAAGVDIAAAVHQAHQAVDRKQGWGQYQPQNWRDVPDRVLYEAKNEGTWDNGKPILHARQNDYTGKDVLSPLELHVPVGHQVQNPLGVESPPTDDEERSAGPDLWRDSNPWVVSEGSEPVTEDPSSVILDAEHPYPPTEFSWPQQDVPAEVNINNDGDEDAIPVENPVALETSDETIRDRAVQNEMRVLHAPQQPARPEVLVPKADKVDFNGEAAEQDGALIPARRKGEMKKETVDRAIPNAPRKPLKKQGQNPRQPAILADQDLIPEVEERMAPEQVVEREQPTELVAEAREVVPDTEQRYFEENTNEEDGQPEKTEKADDADNPSFEVPARAGVRRDDPPPVPRVLVAPHDSGKFRAALKRKAEPENGGFAMAAAPRQIAKDGAAALAAAGNMRRRPNGRRLRTATDTAEML